jgi:hypothetical protein
MTRKSHVCVPLTNGYYLTIYPSVNPVMLPPVSLENRTISSSQKEETFGHITAQIFAHWHFSFYATR